MNTVLKEERYTSDEFLAMTDLEGRYELIYGEIVDMSPAPIIRHQKLSMGIASEIRDYIRKHKGKCNVFAAPTDVKLNDDCIVQPDIFVVCDENKLDEKKCNGAPDWVIEILSPSTSSRDFNEKLRMYLESGVREYWIVDPDNNKVFVHTFGNPNIMSIYSFSDKIPAAIYKDCEEPLTICPDEV